MLKNLRDTYRCFCGRLYSAVILLVMPALIIIYQVFTASVMGPGNLMYICIYIIALGCIADYFAFNGITSRHFSFGMLRCCNSGRKLVKEGIMIDQIRRFSYICFVIFISMVITVRVSREQLPQGYIAASIAMILFTYSANTIALMVLRNIAAFLNYSIITGILTAVFAAIGSIFFYSRYESGKANIVLWLIILLLLSVLSTLCMLKVVLNNFDRSFYGDKR
ncbi:hypothetical protein [Butyrivibrio sp. YAB3001]|uniref:hypothetical protein n=1 Tax=Butyrivibrio sp. YAB3001 TaxID=1520812 RepID=UPI0008F686A9|nr:hypothetical protein [Butyrivibrio sp. YAB3001]SFC11496.1 hypothetical protein SAMN02910398_01543 [Butyrivibrio sp. YAB3001]